MSIQREDPKKTDVESEHLLSDTLQVLVGPQTLPPSGGPARSLVKTFPRWWKVASLWFNSEHPTFASQIFLDHVTNLELYKKCSSIEMKVVLPIQNFYCSHILKRALLAAPSKSITCEQYSLLS